MSQPDLSSANPPRSTVKQRPKSNIYTVLLGVSTMALLFACLLLYLEIQKYGGFGAIRGPL